MRVGVIILVEIANKVKGFWPVSDRVILIKIDVKPVEMSVLQVAGS